MNENSKNFIILPIALLLVVVVTGSSVVASTGMMSYLIKIIGGMLAIASLAQPKMGAYVLLVEAFFVDMVKRYAVYYGAASMDTVVEVMVVQMLAVCGLLLAIGIKVLRKDVPFRKWPFAFVLIGLFCGAVSLVLSDAGMNSAIKDSFNLGAYIALVWVFYHLFVDMGMQIRPFFNTMLWLGMLSSLVALRQSYLGFSDIEDFYMQTGFSAVASKHYYQAIAGGVPPRGFGLASGVMNFVAMGGLAVYACFSFFNVKVLTKRVFFGFAYVLITFALFKVRMKTGVSIALFAPIAIVLSKSNRAIYMTLLLAVFGFVILVLNSVEIRNSIAAIDHAFRGALGIGDVYTIQTFEARLHSYSSMLKAENWQPFGVGGELEVHDVITYILLRFGYIPLAFAAFVGMGVIVLLLNQAKRLSSEVRSKYMAFQASFGMLFLASVVGGSNLHSNPVNFVLWTCLAAALAVGWNGELEEQGEWTEES